MEQPGTTLLVLLGAVLPFGGYRRRQVAARAGGTQRRVIAAPPQGPGVAADGLGRAVVRHDAASASVMSG